jgi:hypothetical protein
VLRRILGPKRDEVVVDWRKLHNEELNDKLLTKYAYYSDDQIDKNEIGWTRSKYGRAERCMWGFGRELDRKRPLGRSGRKWKDNIKMDLQEVGWGMD